MGRWFIIQTDQKSLKFLFVQRAIGPEYQRWVCKLLGFDFEIQYKVDHLNRAADALSQIPAEAECASLISPQWRDWEQLKAELGVDKFLKRVMHDLS